MSMSMTSLSGATVPCSAGSAHRASEAPHRRAIHLSPRRGRDAPRSDAGRGGWMAAAMIHRRIDADILATINYDAVRGMTPSQIQRELARDMALRGRMPTLRTIQRIVADTIGRDDSGEWHLAPEGPDPAAVLWVLAASLRAGWEGPISEAGGGWPRAVPPAARALC